MFVIILISINISSDNYRDNKIIIGTDKLLAVATGHYDKWGS